MPHELPLFYNWSGRKILDYSGLYPDDFRKNPSAPPRKGVPPGKEYPLSLTKYEAAVYSVLYGTKLTDFKLDDVLGLMESPPSSGLFRVWRSEERFKSIVNGLKEEFAEYMARNIVFDNEVGFYDDRPGEIVTKGLYRKILFMMEAFFYSPDLIGRISSTIVKQLNSQKGNQSISNYLGYFIWCIIMLHLPERFGKKSRQRSVYIDVCKKIIGVKAGDEFLMNYLREGVYVKRGNLAFQKDLNKDPNQRSTWYSQYLSRELFTTIQGLYRGEFADILNTEIQRMATSENTLTPEDIMTGVNFMANKYRFYRSDD